MLTSDWAFSLFGLSFLSATLLPATSEAYLAYLLGAGKPTVALVAVAAAGNVLGAFTNYLIGRWARGLLYSRWLGFHKRSLARARIFFRRWGNVALFLSFLPILGDPVTAVAGVMAYPLPRFLFWVTLGKVLRYTVVAILFQ